MIYLLSALLNAAILFVVPGYSYYRSTDAQLHPNEIRTIGMLFCLKGGRFRAFYHWFKGDWLPLILGLPERTRGKRNITAMRGVDG